MEFSLNNKVFEYLGAVYKNSFTREVTTESIIPDSLPDVQRVIETEAMACLRSKETDEGRVTVNGTIDVSVIYADDEGHIKRTQLNVPFSAAEENRNIKSGSKVMASVKIASADTRMLNPRKLLIRCDVLIEAACYEPKELKLNLPSGDKDEKMGVQLLSKDAEVCVVTDISEKMFVIREEYGLPSSKPPVGELLRTKLDLNLEELTAVGNKVIIKGTVIVNMLYRPEKGGEPVNTEFSVVFSQIMEPGVQMEGLEFNGMLVPTSVYFNTDDLYASEDRRIVVEAHLLAQCVAFRKENISYIADAYSCKYEMSTDTANMEMNTVCGMVENVESVRGVVESVRQPGNIISISALPGLVYKSVDGDKITLKTTVCINVLYISEDGVLLSASKKIGASTSLPLEADMNYSANAYIHGEPLGVISTEGIEVKLNLAFKAECYQGFSFTGVNGINVDTDNPKDMSSLPSIVVKRFEKGDTLWKLAKKYSSVSKAILKANGLESYTEPETDSIIIIPKAR